MTESGSCGCKIGRLLATYGIEEFEQELIDHWTGASQQYSLRQLAEEFNLQLLESAITDAREQPLDGELENLYRLLTDDDVTSGMRAQAKNRLREMDIDPDSIQDDFVSHQTIYRHLNDCRNVEHGSATDPVDKLEQGKTTLQSMRSRTRAVTENTVDRLSETDHLDLEGFDVLIDVSIICDQCGTEYTIDELFEATGCTCQGSDEL